MLKVVTNSLGSGDWIVVQGHSGSTLFSGHRIGAHELKELLDIISRDGGDLIEVNDEQMEEEYTG